jgi:hypothetical protein
MVTCDLHYESQARCRDPHRVLVLNKSSGGQILPFIVRGLKECLPLMSLVHEFFPPSLPLNVTTSVISVVLRGC